MASADGDNKIRVMLVDDIAETRDTIRRLLQFESDIEVVADARTGREGIELAKKHQPHVVLMDINMPDMNGIEATEQIVKQVPRTQIIILSVQADPDYMRKAMIVGARDFLTKPPNSDELIATIRRMHEAWKARASQISGPAVAATGDGGSTGTGTREGKVITVYSPKGGSGTTTVATNLALALQSGMRNSQVLLIDGDLRFGDVGIFLNIDSAKFTFYDVATGVDALDNEFLSNVLIRMENNLRVLVAPHTPADADAITSEQIKKAIAIFKRLFDYIVVDTASEMTDATLTFVENADRVILLTTPDIPSIAGARKFFEVLQVLGYPEQQVFFAVNRVDKTGITPKDISDSLKHAVRAQLPFDHYGVLLSINRGQPLVLNSKASPVSDAIKRLAASMVEDLREQPAEEPKQSASLGLGRRPPQQKQAPSQPQKRRPFGA